eukprot:TRINITY_DN97_c0_g1_i1.p1 TRINITY_DN97_c0_g1~~TRINITY_DN97_c0_g1_i1.p1  ORF type:complete len:472 (-),score=162.89 TRINITY_DN97_c0_g1_i1:242-1501(-)
MRFLVLAAFIGLAAGIDNGRGVKPPMGWRSWNLFGADVNQQLIMSQMDGITSRNRTVNGVPTSLADLGFNDVGLDDNWQLCGSYGPNKYTFHNADGFPVVNKQRFPDFIAMTTYAHNLNLTAGWYGNNCICSDHCSDITCYQGDVDALMAFGFDSIKLDGCGEERDLDLYAALFNATGKAILIENCHWGGTVPNATWCPWNYFRTSGDIRASYAAVVSNLQTVIQWATQKLSTPGCWAYPDMLEVGCAHGPGGPNDPGLSFVEARSHFGAWCVVSSPLILSHDMNNNTISDAIWPIISNTEAIGVNQAWAGESGNVFAQSKTKTHIWSRSTEIGWVTVPSWQQWYKPINSTAIAVLVMNHADSANAITVDFSAIPGLASSASYKVRDIWAHQDLGTFSTSWTTPQLPSHDSSFLIVAPA